jgi:cyclophilin family peptidyl-prolyl cis-trans isomerase
VHKVGFFVFVLALLVGCSSEQGAGKRKPGPKAAGPNPVVLMETSLGNIKIELFEEDAPETVANFLQYVDDKHYDGTIFHRVIPTFMIQGGGMEPGLKERKTRAPIKNESDNGLTNDRGTIAMARTPNPHSATAQFFINVKDNQGLDKANSADRWGYAVFGKVVEGMDGVDKIKAVPTGSKGGHDNVPVQDVVIKSVRRVESKTAK